MSLTFASRRAFAINGLVAVLFLILLAVCAYRGWMMYDRISAMGAYGEGKKAGVIVGSIAAPLIALALAGGIGALAYFLARKSDAAANAAIGLVLLLALGLYGYSAYRLALAPPPRKPPTLAEQHDTVREQLQQQAEAQRAANERNLQAIRDAMANHPTPQPIPAVPSTPSPGATPRSPTAQPPPRPAARPEPEPDHPAIQPALAALTQEIDTACNALADQAGPLLTAWTRQPRHDVRELDKRVADSKDLQAAAHALEKRLRDIGTQIREDLSTMGVEPAAASAAAARFEQDLSTIWRANACGSYARLCDTVREEAQYLRQNFGQWTLDSKGEFTARDFSLKAQASGKRMFVESATREQEELDSRIRGKK